MNQESKKTDGTGANQCRKLEVYLELGIYWETSHEAFPPSNNNRELLEPWPNKNKAIKAETFFKDVILVVLQASYQTKAQSRGAGGIPTVWRVGEEEEKNQLCPQDQLQQQRV